MNNAKCLLLLLLTLLLAGCNNGDEEDPFVLNKEFLKQTSWKGIAMSKGNEYIFEESIGILFATDKRGDYELHSEGSDPMREVFQYEMDGNLLTISKMENGSLPYLRGDWMVVEKGKDRLVLVRGINNEYSESITLELTRNY